MDVLSRIFRGLKKASQFSFHPKCVQIYLTHLIFADDLLVFVRGDLPSLQAVKQCLHLFSCYSGLVPNPSKTNVYFAGVRSDVKALILRDTGYVEDHFPFKYLGIPLHSSRLTRDLLQPLLARIRTKMGHWESLHLTYAGKVTLINSVIFGIEAFWCASLLLPKGIIKELESKCRKFLWGTTGNRRFIFFSWEKVCRARKHGGLGIREVLSWNKALLLHMFWKLCHKPTSIWMQWSHHYIFKKFSCWELSSEDCLSSIWTQILRIRDDFIQLMGSREAAQRCFQHWVTRLKFPVLEAYSVFRGEQLEPKWMLPIMDFIVIPRHALTATLAAQNGLATVDNLCTRGLVMVNRCVLCCRSVEDAQHLFFACPFSKNLMKQILVWQGVSRRVLSLKHELYKLATCRGTTWRRKIAYCATAATIHHVWQERNMRIFHGVCLIADRILARIKYEVCVRVYAWQSGIDFAQLPGLPLA
ncbi:uncharacterized protein LOC141651414 [Silene latifolia]|uniref:uncharacterized protein LOC141651414 n=1 Tax=Silene latifolia TaxID=37657 RepID=UPI003D77FDC0